MRRTKSIRSIAFCVALVLAAPLWLSPISVSAETTPQAIPDFTITGAGNGHGIGMSQYGTQGFALRGWKYDAILKRYYQGTSVASATNVDMRVYLDKSAATRSSWTVKAVGSPLTAYSGSTSKELAADTYYKLTCSSAGVVTIATEGGSVAATFSGDVTVRAKDTSKLVEFKDVSGPPLNASYPNGYPYMRYRGKVQFVRSAAKLSAINIVPLQSYLYGVVPRESPASWHAEALKAQAVAARSYAKAKADPNDDGKVDATVKCTTADQVYGGHSRLSAGDVVMHEASSTNSAVDATSGKVVKSGSSIIMTFFFSASGGHTANIEDSWGYSDPKPYYVGVSDPYEADAGSPYMSWTVKKSGLTVAKNLKDSATVSGELSKHGLAPVPTGAGTSVYVSGVRIARGVSGYPRWVTFTFSNGASVKLTSYTVKSALGLKSPNFSFSGFPMERVFGASRYSTAIKIAQRAYPGTSTAVVLASGEAYADALAGSAVAGALDGPVLLSARDSVSSELLAELGRLKPTKVYIMGGSAAISPEVEARIKSALPSATISRVKGADRYGTALEAAEFVSAIDPPSTVIVASGMSWPDAAVASALAFGRAYPILYSASDGLSAAAKAYLTTAAPAKTLVIGGESVLSAKVASDIQAATGKAPERLWGKSRYATAAAVANYEIYDEFYTFGDVYLATGEAYPDALTGGVLAGKLRHPLTLTARDSVPASTATFLRSLSISKLWLFGGTAAISAKGVDALDATMND